MSMKINRLEIENVKRIKAVKLEPAQNGLTNISPGFHCMGTWRGALQTFPEYKGRLHGAAELTYCDEQWFGSGA